ncbi:3-hydroxymyristoyl/3-hydroxydecanoyl-(acyl carrier protein) dehydratase [Rhodococcus sp. 27YEA15]|uniref:beta-ketoacyl synthase n=1 Tax=Rhodococcus sp. 27YEA15 TaxID=3156259 RepID=UPI003C7A80F0
MSSAPPVLEFDGVPFDPVGATRTEISSTKTISAPSGRADVIRALRSSIGADTVLAEMRSAMTAAHSAAVAAQVSMQRRIIRHAVTGMSAPTSGVTPIAAPAAEGAFKPLARSVVTALDRSALSLLAQGATSEVFGPAYDQSSANPELRPALGVGMALDDVSEIRLRGGASGLGALSARFRGGARAAAVQAGEVFALYAGLHLCIADASLVAEVSGAEADSDVPDPRALELTVTEIDLVPRPHLTVEVLCTDTRGAISVTLTVQERSGTPIGPGPGGVLDAWTGRVAADGSRALLSEFHMAHLARGDQAVALGPEFGHYTGIRATRLPSGGLLLVDRVVEFDGQRGVLDQPQAYRSEYDSPADSWYYSDTANHSMPHFVYMETSLQAALLMGYFLGPTLDAPDTTQSLRNLGGTATVLHRVDLRDRTVTQHSRLLSTTLLPGSSLQSFDYSLSVNGRAFYEGETMFGYFSDEALGNQAGLDAGTLVPTWISTQGDSIDRRRIDVAGRRADDSAVLCSRGKLALLDWIDVVDGGGHFGHGCLHSIRRIDPQDWFFARHFHLDPVIPGSLGVETVIQAMQEWIIDTGTAAEFLDPVFVIPPGIPFTWKYRGQFLPSDVTCEVEVHIKSVTTSSGGVIVVADASLWKPGLRIYELCDISVELVERKALA